MHTASFFKKIRSYYPISELAELAWTKLLQEKTYKKGENFITEGQKPKKVAFVSKGLFSQYYIADNGDTVIKYFFPEERLAASVSAMLSSNPGIFTITAIENTTVLEYDFFEFKKLFSAHPDIASFYINYIELHWIIEKEPLENLVNAMPSIKHVHLADVEGRVAPGESGKCDYRPLFKALKAGD